MTKWNDILKIKVEDSPIGDMEQYERDSLRADSELSEYRFEGWPQNEAELKEALERDFLNYTYYARFWRIVGDDKKANSYEKKIPEIMRLIQNIDSNTLGEITNESSPYYQQMNESSVYMGKVLENMRILLAQVYKDR